MMPRRGASPRLDRYNTANTMQIFTGKLLLFLVFSRTLPRIYSPMECSPRSKEQIDPLWWVIGWPTSAFRVVFKVKISRFVLLLKVYRSLFELALMAATNLSRTLNQNKTKNWRYWNNFYHDEISNEFEDENLLESWRNFLFSSFLDISKVQQLGEEEQHGKF